MKKLSLLAVACLLVQVFSGFAYATEAENTTPELGIWNATGLNAQNFSGGEKDVSLALFQLNASGADVYLDKLTISPNGNSVFGVATNLRVVDYHKKTILASSLGWKNENGDYKTTFTFSEPVLIKKDDALAININADIDSSASSWKGSDWSFFIQIDSPSDVVAHLKGGSAINPSSEFPVVGIRIGIGDVTQSATCKNEITYQSWEYQAGGSCILTTGSICRDSWSDPIPDQTKDECEKIHAKYESKTEQVRTVPPAGYEDAVLTKIDSYKNPFPDTDTSSLAGKAASELYRRAVIGGYPDGEFKGSKEVNRAEASKFLLYARYGTVADTANNGKFRDVLDGQWYTKFIVDASKRGIINGYADGTFGPGNTVNTAEFLKMLTLTFGLQTNLTYSYTDVATTDWFAPYAGTAAKYNLFPNRTGTLLNPSKNLTREEVAVAIYQYLSQR